MRFPLPLALIFIAVACSGPQSSTSTGTGADSATKPEPVVALVEETAEVSPTETELSEPPAPLAPLSFWGVSAGIPKAQARLEEDVDISTVRQRFEQFHAWNPEHRLYIHTDLPLYEPGESIHVRAWDFAVNDLSLVSEGQADIKLVGPRGDTIETQSIELSKGKKSAQFDLAKELVGGEYKLELTAADGLQVTRSVMVRHFEPPRIIKNLDFERESYGPGDEVVVMADFSLATGEKLRKHPITALVRFDNAAQIRQLVETSPKGGLTFRFDLPENLYGGALLSFSIEDGGVTESISRAVPIAASGYRLLTFPEGGDLVAGLPNRIFVELLDQDGTLADAKLVATNAAGAEVAHFTTINGRGDFTFVPEEPLQFHIADKPSLGVANDFPQILDQGCVMSTFDDFNDDMETIVVGLRCTDYQELVLVGAMRKEIIDLAKVEVKPEALTVVHLEDPLERQGIARVTLLTDRYQPLAERLVYRGHNKGLQVELSTEFSRYAPQDEVEVTVKTSDSDGDPVAAELSLAVADAAVLNLADDRSAQLMAQIYLLPELRDAQSISEPNQYFDAANPDAGQALDRLLATRGWRRFAWETVLADDSDGDHYVDPMDGCPLQAEDYDDYQDEDGCPELDNDWDGIPDTEDKCPNEAETFNEYKDEDGCPEKDSDDDGIPDKLDKCDDEAEIYNGYKDEDGCPDEVDWKAKDVGMVGFGRGGGDAVFNGVGRGDVHVLAGKAEVTGALPGQAKRRSERKSSSTKKGKTAQRRFAPPLPQVEIRERSDFRKSLLFEPSVVTNSKGVAKIKFKLSDSITSFQITAEGVGAGQLGRGQSQVSSVLPMSVDIRLPLEVSEGDRIMAPITLSSQTEDRQKINLSADFGELVKVAGSDEARSEQRFVLKGRSRQSVFVPIDVTGVRGTSQVTLAATSSQHGDGLRRELNVVPKGFPQLASASGRVAETARGAVSVATPVKGTVQASLRLYPTPVASMQSGMDGLLRQPGGCFEQASSSNYPNVMIMRYLDAYEVDDPETFRRSNELLNAGYQLLTGYETPQKGYEWFGSAPGHEALTAYGLMEFSDMSQVYEVDPKMVDRTAQWLLDRRDGQGGFKRNELALDSFGRASKEVTDAYITWALCEAGYASKIDDELEKQAELVTSKDPYLLALAANALLTTKRYRKKGLAAVKALEELQGSDGAWATADHSITRSGGTNLTIETTALAARAIMTAEGDAAKVEAAIEWLNNNRGGYGQWGATQATVLALDTMTRYVEFSSQAQEAGTVHFKINGVEVGSQDFAAGTTEPIVFEGFGELIHAGDNDFEIELSGNTKLGYSLAVDYYTEQPTSSPEALVDLDTQLADTQIAMGDSTQLKATITNKSAAGQPMTIARLGIPAGLEAQDWQLKALRDKGAYDFFELRPREVILYYRALEPNARREVELELMAMVPGTYSAPASSAYLYYTDEHKTWVPSQGIEIME